MRKIRAAVVDATMWRAAMVGATLLAAAAVASAHAQSPQVADAGGSTIAPTVPTPPAGEAGSRPLFSIGKLEVHLWAPVEAAYDAHMNHTAAANPMWESGE